MATSVQMPKLGESVVEGTVTRWLKAPGTHVAKLEPLLEISTDKIDTEIPSPAEGTLLEILIAEGTTVAVGTPLAVIGLAGETNAESGMRNAESSVMSIAHPTLIPSYERPAGRAFISPVVAKLAKEHNLDLDQIAGSGLSGRITKKDVLAFIETSDQPLEIEDDSALRIPHSTLLPVQSTDEILYPLTTLRRAIAQHMVLSKQTSPHVTTIFEVDLTAVVLHRDKNKQRVAEKGVNLTFTPYFVAAAAKALRAVPYANGRFSENGILVNRRIHIGVAVAVQQKGESGLLVPVLRDADEKNLAGLARSVNELAERTRAGKLSADELIGGTFTISNHGVGGSLVGTPIINQPQAAILGIGAITKRPIVRNGNQSLLPSADDAIVIRPMCYLSLSFDHRILDGASADQFLTVVKQTLENWTDK